MYVLICLTEHSFFLRRDHILFGEYLFEIIESERVSDVFSSFEIEQSQKNTQGNSSVAYKFNLKLYLTKDSTADILMEAVNILRG